MSSRTEDVLLMIADISGYTRFMVANQTELEHSHQIVGALLEAIIEEVEIPLEVAKLEGDAVFLYLVKADDRDAALPRARAKLMRFFAAFQSTGRGGRARSPSAFCRHSPSTMPVSSVVWW